MESPKTLLLLTSRQVWPNIISVTHFRPERVVLLHTGNRHFSQGPAMRLRTFFETSGLLGGGACELVEVAEDDFHAIQKSLDGLPEGLVRGAALGFGGATKLIAVAAFEWARRRGVPAFYLEQDNEMQRFAFSGGDVIASTDRPDLHATDGIDPIALMRCQADFSEIAGELEPLEIASDEIRTLGDSDFDRRLYTEMARRPEGWLRSMGARGPAVRQEGDMLEYAVVLAALRAGARRAVRGLRLSVTLAGSGMRTQHAEMDVVFSYGARMWAVECKDRYGVEKARGLIKEKLVSAWDIGGDLGRLVYVARSEPSDSLRQFAGLLGVHVLWKGNLRWGMEDLLRRSLRHGQGGGA